MPAWDEPGRERRRTGVIAHSWDELRLLMWNYVGIVRATRHQARALHRIKLLRRIDDYYANFRVSRDLLDCATWSVRQADRLRSALMRHELTAACTTAAIPEHPPVSPDRAGAPRHKRKSQKVWPQQVNLVQGYARGLSHATGNDAGVASIHWKPGRSINASL